MRTLLTSLLLALAASTAFAQLPVDFLAHWNGQARGPLTNTGTYGVADMPGLSGEWKWTQFKESVSNRMFIAANDLGATLQWSVNGSPMAHSTNVLMMDSGTNLAPQELNVYLGNPFSDQYSVTNILFVGLVRYCLTNDYDPSGGNIDSLMHNDGGGAWSVMQSRAREDEVIVTAHSHYSFSGTIHLEQCKTYLFEWAQDDVGDGELSHMWIRFRDPADNFAIVQGEGGVDQIGIQKNAPGVTWGLHFKVGYIANYPGQIYFGTVGAIFNRTNFLSDAELTLLRGTPAPSLARIRR